MTDSRRWQGVLAWLDKALHGVVEQWAKKGLAILLGLIGCAAVAPFSWTRLVLLLLTVAAGIHVLRRRALTTRADGTERYVFVACWIALALGPAWLLISPIV